MLTPVPFFRVRSLLTQLVSCATRWVPSSCFSIQTPSPLESVSVVKNVEAGDQTNEAKHLDVYRRSIELDMLALQSLLHATDTPSSSSPSSTTAPYFSFPVFVDSLLACQSRIFFTAVGKSGVVARRAAASLSSLGLSSEFVHPTEWLHGDLGKLQKDSVVVFMSHSGSTAELISLISHMRKRPTVKLLGIFGSKDCVLAHRCDVSILASTPPHTELLGCVPTGSIIAQEAVINGLLRAVSASKGKHDQELVEDFRINHPGGKMS